MADNGSYFHDTRLPFITGDLAAVSPLATDVALWTVADVPVFPSGYFFPGKRVRMRVTGKISTILTPGNGIFELRWGTGASANGTVIVASAALTLIASQTNIPWWVDILVKCTAKGTSGALYATGYGAFGTAVVAAGAFQLPAVTPATVTADTTAANTLSLQFQRSGSTAETMTVTDLGIYPEN